jgi:hypothetical protein
VMTEEAIYNREGNGRKSEDVVLTVDTKVFATD